MRGHSSKVEQQPSKLRMTGSSPAGRSTLSELSDDALLDAMNDLACLIQERSVSIHNLRRTKQAMKDEHLRRNPDARRVSDHAIVRYLERVIGYDIQAIREALRRDADAAVPCEKAGFCWHPDGHVLVIGDDGQIITVLTEDQVLEWEGSRKEKLPRPSSTG